MSKTLSRSGDDRRANHRWLVMVLPLLLLASVLGCDRPAPDDAVPDGVAPEDAVATTLPRPTLPTPVVEFEPCTPRGLEGEARCGRMSVPENRDQPDGRTIDIRVVILPALGDAPAPDPVVLIPGGPGQGITASAAAMSRLMLPVRGARDLVLFDPRGAGASSLLHCLMAGTDEDPQSYFGDFMPPATVEACRDRLTAEGVDLARYTAIQVVDDLEALRRALGYQTLNLYGVSYGSRIAMAYMRSHPDRVRSAVLNGVAPFDLEVPKHHAPDAQRALDLLFASCVADPACAQAFPDLETKFWAVHRRLAEDGPATTTFHDATLGEDITVTIGLDQFNEEIRWRLYDEESNLIPGLVEETFNGDFRRLGAMLLRLRRVLAGGRAISLGAYLSALCAEDTPFIDPTEAVDLAAGTFLGTYRVDQQIAACDLWPRAALPAAFREPIDSDIPTLLLSGLRDPVTPPKWAEAVLPGLSQGRHVVLQQGFHTERTPCAQTIIAEFFARGSAAGIDDACARTMSATPFALDTTTPTEPE